MLIPKITPFPRPYLPLIALLLTATLVSACRSTEPQQTATAVYERAVAEIASLRATATVARARMQTTLVYIETRVALVQEAREFLRFSLNNLGTDSDFIETHIGQLARVATPAAQFTPIVAAGQAQISAPDEAPTARPLARRTQPATITPSPDRQQPRLEELVLATGVGADDCALDVNPRFTPESSAIYIAARAYNVPAGATITSAWGRQGAEVARFSFQPERAINGDCIWFYIDQSDAAFTVGAWSVEIFVDGISLTSPLAFQIVSG